MHHASLLNSPISSLNIFNKNKIMKLVWCPDTSAKAYIEAVKSLSGHEDANVAELIAATAGGWKAQTVLEARALGDTAATGIALAAAVKHTGGKHVVVHPDESTTDPATDAEEGVDFMVVDMRRRDAARVVREAKAGTRGMVVVCKNVEKIRNGGIVVGEGMRVVRSAYLPIGSGVEIFHVSQVGRGRRWLKHVDRVTGEEHFLMRK